MQLLNNQKKKICRSKKCKMEKKNKRKKEEEKGSKSTKQPVGYQKVKK